MSEIVYDAFISYSHRDLKWGRWLQRRLENAPVPKDDIGQKPLGNKLRVFRDQTDLAGVELKSALHRELSASRYLIVICSPSSAASRWVNDEISYFLSLGRSDHVIPFIVEGEPESDHPNLECYPPALRSIDGQHLLGANTQEIGKSKAFLKLLAILLDIRFNRLVDREKQRKRRNGWIIGLSAAVILGVSSALLLRNAIITRQNKQLSFDIYGAAIVSFARKDVLEPEEAEFLQVSAEAGNVDAMLLLADCYQKGWGVEADPEACFSWYLKAAQSGNTQAMTGVANCYMNGTGTAVDPAQVFAWNLRAAEAGDTSGMLNAASCYEDGYGVEADPEKAFYWYEKAANAGYDLAMYQLARCCRSGIGTAADPTQAFYWMKKLGESGNAEGMYNTGLMYQFGYGTPEDPRQAYLWYRKAAEAGDGDAMYMTGWCTENRYGTEDAALEWYQLAAEKGSVEAADKLRERAAGEDAGSAGP